MSYYYNEATNSYVVSQSIGEIEDSFTGTSGKVLTLYLDGSSLPDGTHRIIMHTAVMHHVTESSEVEHFVSDQKEIYFTISQGKVTPAR